MSSSNINVNDWTTCRVIRTTNVSVNRQQLQHLTIKYRSRDGKQGVVTADIPTHDLAQMLSERGLLNNFSFPASSQSDQQYQDRSREGSRSSIDSSSQRMTRAA